MLERPSSDEYFDFYHTYVGQVPDGEIGTILADQRDRCELEVRVIGNIFDYTQYFIVSSAVEFEYLSYWVF